MAVTTPEAIGAQNITLSLDAGLFLLDRGLQINPDMPHFDACLEANEFAEEGAELLAADLEPIQNRESFAYVVSMPPLELGSLAPEVRANIGRISNLAFVRNLGSLGTSEYEEDGALLSLVTPAEGYEHTQSYRGSEDPLLFHQEMLPKEGLTTRESLTKFVILHCVSDTTPPTPTMASPIRQAIALLTEDERDALRQPVFKLRPYDAMQITQAGVVEEDPEPVLHPDGQVVADLADIETDFPEGKAAFARLLGTANQVALPVVLGFGKTLVVDNYESFHGRGPIPGGHGKRMLIRAHVI